MSDAIVVFARAPVPGQVKTRLARSLGDEAAASLYAAMLRDTLRTAQERVWWWGAGTVWLAYTPDDAFAAGPYSLRHFWDGPRLAQSSGDLGQRMSDCVTRLRQLDAERIVIIGSDIPDMGGTSLGATLRLLTWARWRLILGPSSDGGFYLVGLARPLRTELFAGIDWSAADTRAQLEANAARLRTGVTKLQTWHDVDTEDDLHALAQRLRHPDNAQRAPETARWLRSQGLL